MGEVYGREEDSCYRADCVCARMRVELGRYGVAPRGTRGATASGDTIRNGKLAATESFQTVEPRHNSIVFFQAAAPIAAPAPRASLRMRRRSLR